MPKKRKRKYNTEPKPQLENQQYQQRRWEIVVYALPIAATVCWVIAGMIFFEHRSLGIWLVFAGIVLAALAACLYWQMKVWDAERSLNFSASVISVFAVTPPEAGRTSPFQYAFQTGNGPTITPIYRMMYMRLINDANTPMTVAAYRFESRVGQKWQRLARLDGRFGTVYWALQLNAAIHLEFDTLDAALAEKPIPPHQSITGWILLQDIPSGPMRVYVRDINGNANTVSLNDKKPVLADTEDSLEDAQMRALGGPRTDLSVFRYVPRRNH